MSSKGGVIKSAEEHDGDARSVLGMMGECVMSVYGIARLLRSRELGPAQLLPPIEAFGSHAKDSCGDLDVLFAPLLACSGLEEAATLVEAETRRIGQSIAEVFSRPLGKLGARERLQLERDAERLGPELQAVRSLIEVLRAAQNPNVVRLTLSDLLRGRWCSRPTFVAHRIDLTVPCGDSPSFEGEPRLLWAMVERALRQAADAGTVNPCAAVMRHESGLCLQLGAFEGMDATTIERVVLQVGPGLDIEDRVLGAVSRHCGVDTSKDKGPAQTCIRLVAA